MQGKFYSHVSVDQSHISELLQYKRRGATAAIADGNHAMLTGLQAVRQVYRQPSARHSEGARRFI